MAGCDKRSENAIASHAPEIMRFRQYLPTTLDNTGNPTHLEKYLLTPPPGIAAPLAPAPEAPSLAASPPTHPLASHGPAETMQHRATSVARDTVGDAKQFVAKNKISRRVR